MSGSDRKADRGSGSTDAETEGGTGTPLQSHPEGSGGVVKPIYRGVVVAAWVLATIWWVACVRILTGMFSSDVGASTDPATLVAGIVLTLMPGLVLVLVSHLVWEVRRTQTYARDMAEVVEQLLAPLESNGAEFDQLANAVARHTHRVGRDLVRAREESQQLRGDIESVMVDLRGTADDMKSDGAMVSATLREEGGRLRDTCAHSLERMDKLVEAFPGRATVLVEALAEGERRVGDAESLLGKRVESAARTGTELADKMGEMDEAAAQSEQRAQAMGELVSGIHNRISEMVGRVENVLNAAELARDATRDVVGDLERRLGTAVREGSSLLEKLTAGVGDLERKTDGLVARVEQQATTTEERMTALGDSVYETAAEATRIAETGLNNARARIERAARLLNQSMPAENNGAEGRKAAALRELADKRAQGEKEPGSDSARARNGVATGSKLQDGHADSGISSRKPASWRDLLAGIDQRPGPSADADMLIGYLQDSGIALRRAVSGPDVRRIAAANREGPRARRLATRKLAPGFLCDIEELFEASPELRESAHNFVLADRHKAIGALTRAERAKAGADARLCAYLLLDAALEAPRSQGRHS